MVKTLNVEWLLVRDGVVRVFQKLQSSLGFGEWSKKHPENIQRAEEHSCHSGNGGCNLQSLTEIG